MLGPFATALRAWNGARFLIERRPLLAFAVLAAALTLARIAGLAVSPVELHGDEAQYWAWSRTLAWGYFSKPPLIAWVIAATTGLFGDAEWAVRLSAPIAHGVAGVLLAALARTMFGARALWWAGGFYLLMPAVWLSAAVITTDALLLAAWSLGLLSAWKLSRTGRLGWAIGLGAAIGAGLLAKYAMIYFALGLGLFAFADAEARRALLSIKGVVAAAIALAVVAPNLVWNAINGFVTIEHTAANANWQGALINPGELFDFWWSQLGVFGPVTMALLIWAFVAFARGAGGRDPRFAFLWAFVLPPLAVVSAEAFISRANANWAAAAYPAACVLLAGWITAHEGWPRRLAQIAIVLHAGTGVVFAAVTISPALADAMGLANAFKRARGWEETTAAVRAVYEQGAGGRAYGAVAVDNRLLFYDLLYYGRDEPLPLRMWLRYAAPQSHGELIAPLDEATPEPVLMVNERAQERERITHDFETLTPVGEVTIALGGGRTRPLAFFAGEGFAPLERGPAYEERFAE